MAEPRVEASSDLVADLVVRLALALADVERSGVVAAVEALMAELGSALDVGRVYVFEHDQRDQTTSNTFEWCAPGVSPQRGTLQQMPLDVIEAWRGRFDRGEHVAIEDVRALGTTGAHERLVLELQGISALLVVPLRAAGVTTGFIGLDDLRGSRAWSPRLVTLLQGAASLIGTALARRAIEEAQWKSNEALALSEANLRHILESSEEAVILIDTQRRILDLNASARERALRAYGVELEVGDLITVAIPDPRLAADLNAVFAGRSMTYERLVKPFLEDAPPYWAEIEVHPVRAPGGDTQAVVYRSADVTERRRASEALERGAAFRHALLTLLNDLLAREFGDDLYNHVLSHAVAHVPGAEGGSVVVQREDGRYHYVAAVAYDLESLRPLAYDADELAQTRGTGATVLRPSYDNTHHKPEVQQVLQTVGRVDEIRATLVAPVEVAGERLGYLHLDSFSDPTAFDDGAIELASLLAGTVGMALQRLRLERDLKHERTKLAHMASHDPLTDLPNRVMLADRLEQALARGRRRGTLTALMFLDLDGFKAVNDRFGHLTGDEVLREVGRRLRAAVREEDTVARLGGDEFGVLAAELGRDEDAGAVARKVLDALAAPFRLGPANVVIGGSIGLSLAPTDASDSDAMMRNADLALYRMKREGRGGVAFFTDDLDERMRARAALTEDLRSALASGEGIAVAYQPIVVLETGEVVGVEALARWRHPSRGEVPPTEFVPLAEESGLIGALGDAVVRRACSDLAAWRKAGVGALWRCGINVSAVQLRSESFARELRGKLGDAGLTLLDLTLEVTESALIDRTGPGLEHLARLRADGAHVVIDDFGTGYSSLSRLHRLPVDAVKVDRSFVSALGSQGSERAAAVVDAVVALARGFGLNTVAEGIETEVERLALLRHGCSVGQGFLFAPPLPAQAITERYAR